MPASPRSIVFHYPRPLQSEPTVGSEIHPTRMYEGFLESGYDVHLVDGLGSRRRSAMRSVLDRLDAGERFEFVYSEATTVPTALNEPHHVPARPLMDWRFMRAFRRAGVPVGLFYPDVYWRFPYYDEATTPLKAFAARRLYRFDLRWYRSVLSRLFLPSDAMARWMPGWEASDDVRSLAPGGTQDTLAPPPASDSLRLFYVGAVSRPLYDVGPLVDAVRSVPEARLTICCPPGHASALGPLGRSDRVQVVHETGEAVRARYAEADIACLVFPAIEYRSFAMPVKLFEAIGYGRPVLATAGTAVGEFVGRTGLGWSVDNAELADWLRAAHRDRSIVTRARERVVAAAAGHTWRSRAEYVAEELAAARLPVP